MTSRTRVISEPDLKELARKPAAEGVELANFGIQDVYAALASDSARNQQIVADVLEVVRRGHNPLVLSSRTEHLDRLAEGLSGVEHALILKGGMGKN